MKLGTIAIGAGAVALGLAAWITPVVAQGPLYDRVNVNLPDQVTIGDKTLPPGNYIIQQLQDNGGNSRVLLIYGDNGMKFETSAMTIPTLDMNTPDKTTVILHHIGEDYYFDKIWIQGKNYGYEFPLPANVKEREKEMQVASIPATYTTTETTTTTTETTAPPAEATPQPTTPPVEAAPPEPAAPPQQAEVTPPPTPPAPPAQETMPPETPENTANRELPTTSAGWLMMLLSGGTLSGLGLALRRKR